MKKVTWGRLKYSEWELTLLEPRMRSLHKAGMSDEEIAWELKDFLPEGLTSKAVGRWRAIKGLPVNKQRGKLGLRDLTDWS